MPAVHGTYNGVELEFLNPADEGELEILMDTPPETWLTVQREGYGQLRWPALS